MTLTCGRGVFNLAGSLLIILLLSGCASSSKVWKVLKDPSTPVGFPEEQPTRVDLSMLAEPTVNLNAEGEGTPLRFQVLQLKDDSMLMAADMEQLQEGLEDALGTNYLSHDDFTLLPEQWKFYEPFEIDSDSRYIGVIAYYAQADRAEWKKVVKVSSVGKHYHLLIHLRDSEVELRKEE